MCQQSSEEYHEMRARIARVEWTQRMRDAMDPLADWSPSDDARFASRLPLLRMIADAESPDSPFWLAQMDDEP